MRFERTGDKFLLRDRLDVRQFARERAAVALGGLARGVARGLEVALLQLRHQDPSRVAAFRGCSQFACALALCQVHEY